MRNVRLNPEAVREFAAAKGIGSVAELSRESGIERSNLDRFLSGKRNTRPRHVLTLAKTLGCKPGAILDSSEASLGALMDANAEGNGEPEVVG